MLTENENVTKKTRLRVKRPLIHYVDARTLRHGSLTYHCTKINKNRVHNITVYTYLK